MDLCFNVVDTFLPEQMEELEKEIASLGVQLNKDSHFFSVEMKEKLGIP